MPTKLGLELKTEFVNVENLHPELRARVRLAQADERLQDGMSTRLSSGARTYSQQKALYALYRAGKGNLAANPDGVSSSGLSGSRHQVQSANSYKHGNLPNSVGWAYAIDIGFWKGSPSLAEQKLLREVLGDYGLYAPIIDKGEWWHFVPEKQSGLISLTGYRDVGDNVKNLQKILNIKTDGIYGNQTKSAVEKLQESLKIQPTGDWTVSNQKQFEESLKTIGTVVERPNGGNGYSCTGIFPLTIEDDQWTITLNPKH